MRHPLESVSPARRKTAFVVFLLLTILLMALFQRLDAPLRTEAAPNGIISFELAGNVEKARSILASWGALSEAAGVGVFQPARTLAAFGLGLDYLFMPLYALALSFAVLLVSSNRLGAWMGWLPILAALFDAVENISLLKILTGTVSAPWPQIAAACAAVKFTLLAVSFLFVLLAWLLSMRRTRAS